MNRIFNDPDLVVEDMLRGYFGVHADLVSPAENPRVVKRLNAPIAGKVGVVTGGGSGHEPAFLGYVGENLVDIDRERIPPWGRVANQQHQLQCDQHAHQSGLVSRVRAQRPPSRRGAGQVQQDRRDHRQEILRRGKCLGVQTY